MIENLFKDTCTIERKSDTAAYGGETADEYYVLYENEPCLFIQTIGMSQKEGEAARSTNVDGYLRITREIQSTDRLIIDDYIYDIQDVKEVTDLITERIEYYEGSAIRTKKYSDEKDELVIKE